MRFCEVDTKICSDADLEDARQRFTCTILILAQGTKSVEEWMGLVGAYLAWEGFTITPSFVDQPTTIILRMPLDLMMQVSKYPSCDADFYYGCEFWPGRRQSALGHKRYPVGRPVGDGSVAKFRMHIPTDANGE